MRFGRSDHSIGLIPAVLCCCLALVTGCRETATCQVPRIIRTLPHDPAAYTQGLLLHHGRFYESTGLPGRSSLREVDLETGEVLRIIPLAGEHFGEGLAIVGDRLIQLTWESGLAFVYDLDGFVRKQTFEYAGQGWGLCHDGESLFMSDGSATLYRRDPETFALLEKRQVKLNGRPLGLLNELECVGDHVYANVYMTDRIVKIDKESGNVAAVIDAGMLAPLSGRPREDDAVLNGIAYDPETDTFYLTGKYWAKVFQVRFVSP